MTSLGGQEQPAGVLKSEEHFQAVYNGRFDSNQGIRNAKSGNNEYILNIISKYLQFPPAWSFGRLLVLSL